MADVRHIAGEKREVRADVRETRTIEFVASTSTRDSYGTVLNQANWDLKRYAKNGIIAYQHNVYGDSCNAPNPDDVLGQGRAWVENGQLICAMTFDPPEVNPLAEKVFQKLLLGSLNTCSVGFMPVGEGHYGDGDQKRGGKDETFYFDGQELLEVSVVNIPANPDAAQRQMRTNTARAIMFIKRAMPHLSFTNIERMTVGQVIRALDGHGGLEAPTDEEVHEAEQVVEEVVNTPEPEASEVTEVTQASEDQPVTAGELRAALADLRADLTTVIESEGVLDADVLAARVLDQVNRQLDYAEGLKSLKAENIKPPEAPENPVEGQQGLDALRSRLRDLQPGS